MSEQPGIQGAQAPQPSSASPASGDSGSKATEANKGAESVIMLCSLGMVGCFFLPWIQFIFGELSGYQLQQLPSQKVKFLWLIPIMAFISLVASVAKQSVCTASQLAGAMPVLALIYYYTKFGQDIFQMLRPGAYLTLLLAAVLLIAPRFRKTAPKVTGGQ